MPSSQPKDYAIVVGIDDYPRYGEKGRNLKGAVRDAKRFYDWLVDQNTGGGLESKHCELITSHGNPLSLTQATVDLALDELWEKARNEGGGRRFYFYFSGHGQSIVGTDTVTYDQSLCLPQWSQTMPHAALNADSYPNVVQTCMPFKEIVMFLDCCRVPAIKVRANFCTLGCASPLDDSDVVDKMVFFAAEPMRRAFEGDIGGTTEEEEPEVHGYFTTALLEALAIGSSRAGGGIGAESLWEYLEFRVPQLADEKGRRQSPRRSPQRFSDDVVFGAAVGRKETPGLATTTEPNFEIRFSNERVGPIRLLDSDANLLRDGSPDSGPWDVHLEPGETYMLIDDDNDLQRAFVYLPAMEGKHDTF